MKAQEVMNTNPSIAFTRISIAVLVVLSGSLENSLKIRSIIPKITIL